MSSFYEANAEMFILNTRNVDMSEFQNRFLAALPVVEGRRARILDAGSGSGRDARAFQLLGYDVEAFDASLAMVEATRKYAGVVTQCMRFEDFTWDHPFEGIWACASLLHVAEQQLPNVIDKLAASLTPGGVLFLSFKLGAGERLKDGRRFTDMDADRLTTLLKGCNELSLPEIWLSSDGRRERASETWVNALVRTRS
jgi:SAM-dependent methyltransferase